MDGILMAIQVLPGYSENMIVLGKNEIFLEKYDI
jgi:hypothetical protein